MEKSLFLCPWEPESKSTSQNMCFGQPSLTTYFNSLVDGSPRDCDSSLTPLHFKVIDFKGFSHEFVWQLKKLTSHQEKIWSQS